MFNFLLRRSRLLIILEGLGTLLGVNHSLVLLVD